MSPSTSSISIFLPALIRFNDTLLFILFAMREVPVLPFAFEIVVVFPLKTTDAI
jgi:hypothetical protein